MCGEFIKNFVRKNADYVIVKTIKEIAIPRDLATIAEYVENHENMTILRAIGVVKVEVLGIGKPCVLAELEIPELTNTLLWSDLLY